MFIFALTRVMTPPFDRTLGVIAKFPYHEYFMKAESRCVSWRAIICVLDLSLWHLFSNCFNLSLFFRPLQFCVINVKVSGPGLDSMSPDRNNVRRLTFLIVNEESNR